MASRDLLCFWHLSYFNTNLSSLCIAKLSFGHDALMLEPRFCSSFQEPQAVCRGHHPAFDHFCKAPNGVDHQSPWNFSGSEPSDPKPPVKCVPLWWKQTAEHAGGPAPSRTTAGRNVGTASSSLPELGADGFAVSSSPWVSLQLLSPWIQSVLLEGAGAGLYALIKESVVIEPKPFQLE